ncbi:MAG: DegT/DnrJ/EryC1/StrS family aminotransferase, partial [Kofleriaceae bacterium]
KLVEDCAIAIGARYKGKHVGLFGDYGTFSFYPVKHITTGEGGMFLSKNAELAAQVARLRAFGVDRTHSERSIPGMYEVPSLGLNYRMSEMQAALGRTQTAKLGRLLEARAVNFKALRDELSSIDHVRVLDSQHAHAVNSHYCAVAVLEGKYAAQRNEIIGELNARGIGTSIYYPQPVPRMKYYRDKYGYAGDAYPNATEISDCSIALPVGPHLGVAEMKQIADALRAVLAKR